MGGWRRRRWDLARARYAGGRPTEEVKAIHRRYVDGPLPRLLPIAAVLEVPGRVSGATVQVPLVIVPYRLRWYVVSMLGADVNWVRNVQAAGGDAVLLHGRRRPVHLVEVPVRERAPIIRRYLLVAWGARPHMAVSWRSPSREVAALAAGYPVFRVDRRQSRRRPRGLARESAVSGQADRQPTVPPPWVVHTFWRAHRALYRISGGRFLWTTSSRRGWGALRLTTVGRRSGQQRSVILGYLEEGPDLVTLAMNGWDEGHPAWWLNLEAHPEAVVRLDGERPRAVHAREAVGDERDRLWQRWAAVDRDLDAFARRRATVTPVVVLEPRDRTV